ncbi:alpha/beta fold hydrolase [Marinobacter sp. PE14]
MLIHGTASSLHTWDEWAEGLKSDYRVIRLDLPGFGLTGPDRADRYEIEDDVRLLTAFLARLGLEKVHLAGSSLGGRIAWQLALEYPENVESLTLLNALGYPQERWPLPIEMAQWPIMDKVMANVSPRFMYASGLKDVYFDDTLVDAKLADRYFELSRYPGNLAASPKRVQARLDKDASLIPGIRVPTLILWGDEDTYFPVDNAHRFGADIANSSVHVYPDVGHLPMEEVPELSLAHFTAFIRENAAQ